MRKTPLNQEQINNLRKDRDSGMSIGDMSFKYNIGKSSIYSYLSKEDEKEIKQNIVEQDDDNYLDHVAIKDDDQNDQDDTNDKDDDIINDIKNDLKVRKTRSKKTMISKDTSKEMSIIDKLMNKNNDKKDDNDDNFFLNDKEETKQNKKQVDKKSSKIPENKTEKIQKIMKIKNYVLLFQNKLSDILDIDDIDDNKRKQKMKKYILSLSKLNNDQLDIQLDIIRQSLGNISSHKALKLGYLSVIDIIEKIGGRMVDIEGFKKDVEDNEQIDQIIKEISCEYDIFSKYIDPKYRLMGITGFQLMSTYKKNQIIKRQQDIINKFNVNKEISEDIENKYNDL